MSIGGSAGVPPQNFGTPPASGSVGFPGATVSLPCGFSIGLPAFGFGFQLPSLAFLLPGIFAAFKLSCDLSNPVNITAGMTGAAASFGGGRPNTAPPDPDLDDASP